MVHGTDMPEIPLPKALFTYEQIQQLAEVIKSKTTYRPEVLIIAGSGLGLLADTLTEVQHLPYEEIQGFPRSTVAGHKGRFVFGKLEGKEVVVMQGRFHFYEGYHLHQVTLPVRVMHMMGVKKLLVTNAAGGLNRSFKTGHIMVIDDHINVPGMAGFHALAGPNEERYGPRFLPMGDAYSNVDFAVGVAKELGMSDFVAQGVYVFLSGPTYETVAECKMLAALGGDAVGMSTVPEVIVAHHCGMKVLGLSLITNMVKMDKKAPDANHEEVLEIANMRSKDMQNFVGQLVKRWE